MTILPEALTRAIERRPELHKLYETSLTTGPMTAALWEKIRLSTVVADAFTDRRKITRDLLLELKPEIEGHILVFGKLRVTFLSDIGHGEHPLFWVDGGRTANPSPEEMRDVYYLIERLNRKDP